MFSFSIPLNLSERRKFSIFLFFSFLQTIAYSDGEGEMISFLRFLYPHIHHSTCSSNFDFESISFIFQFYIFSLRTLSIEETQTAINAGLGKRGREDPTGGLKLLSVFYCFLSTFDIIAAGSMIT